MKYIIHLSEQSDEKLHQMCDPPRLGAEGPTISAEDFLSALVEEELDKLLAARHRRHSQRLSQKNKEPENAVRLGKARAKTWQQAVAATHAALESVRKLVVETTANGEKRPSHPSKYSSPSASQS